MRLDKLLIAAGFVGPVIFFLSLFVFGLMVEGYNPLQQYISELGAVDSPVGTITNVFGFSLFGIFQMIFAYGIYRCKELRWGKLSALFFFLAGLSVYLVGIFPCDAGCQNFTTQGSLHEKASNYPFPLMTIGFILFAFDIISNKKLMWLTPVILLLGIITLVLAYFSILSQIQVPYPGALQRATIGLPYIIMMIIAVTLYRKTDFNRKI